MADYRFTVDSTLVTNPTDWRGLIFRLYRDKELPGVLESVTSPTIFAGDGYTVIHDAWEANQVGVIDVLIEKRCESMNAWETFFTGKMPLSDCIFNISKCIVETNILEASWDAYIKNNLAAKYHLDVIRSKNDTAITAATPLTITFFTPSTGAYNKADRTCWTVFECMKYSIAFLTDSQVQFASSVFDSLGEFEGWAIMTGDSLRLGVASGDPVPYISFGDLMKEINKKANFAFYIDGTTAPPTFNVEKASTYFFGAEVPLTLSNVKSIEQSTDMDMMYGTVKIGSSKTEPDGGVFLWPDGLWMSHKDETYNSNMQSNTTAELDLVNDWIIDHNVIEDVLINSNDEYDDDIFIVELDIAGLQAVQGTQFLTIAGQYTYNETYQNSEVMQRWVDIVPVALSQYTGTAVNECEIEQGGQATTIGDTAYTLMRFQNEISDPGNNYNNAIGQFTYTAPTTGTFSFRIYEIFSITYNAGIAGTTTVIEIEFRKYDALNTLLETRLETITATFSLTGQFAQITDTAGVMVFNFNSATYEYDIAIDWTPASWHMTATDYTQAYFRRTTIVGLPGVIIMRNNLGVFECTSVSDTTGIVFTPNIENVRNIVFKFTHPLTMSQYETIRDNKIDLLPFTGAPDGNTRYGWIKDINYRPEDAEADFTLIVSKSQATDPQII